MAHPWRALPNMSNWQRCVSNGHQRSSLIQEKHAVLFLKNLQTGFTLSHHRKCKVYTSLWWEQKEHKYLHLHSEQLNTSAYEILSCSKCCSLFLESQTLWLYLFYRSQMDISRTRLNVTMSFLYFFVTVAQKNLNLNWSCHFKSSVRFLVLITYSSFR